MAQGARNAGQPRRHRSPLRGLIAVAAAAALLALPVALVADGADRASAATPAAGSESTGAATAPSGASASTGTAGATSAPPTPTLASAPNAVPPLNATSFADPPASVRPSYFWWQPLAYTDDDELAAELHQIKRAGGGSALARATWAEGPGANQNPFLQTYGWGTPRWTHKVEAMYRAARAEGLRLDLTIGPRWPAIVPTVSDVNDPRAAQQLIFSYEFHPGGASRDGELPSNFNVDPPDGARKTLIAALVARCSDAGCADQSSGPRLLDESSVTDVTSAVDADGHLRYDFPGGPDSTYALIAFYQTAEGSARSGYTATGPNYYLDYLSEAGAKASTDFFDDNILTPSVRRLIDQTGGSDLYDDSLELGSHEKWTWDFVGEFKRRRGYSPIKLLPALADIGHQGVTAAPFFDFGGGVGARVRTDYRQTWSDLYLDNHVGTLERWTHGHEMRFRAQAYGAPIDLAQAASRLDVPSTESLAFGDDGARHRGFPSGNETVEDYKVVASGAHMSGQPVVATECCALRSAVWATTAAGKSDAANLPAVYKGFAGGTNRVIWHGFPYLTRGPEGGGPQELWPGMSYGGNTSFGAAFGPRSPSWSDYRAVNDNVSRLQLVLRQGAPRFDVGVYWQDFGLTGHGTSGVGRRDALIPSSSAMAAAGYTYEYVSPAFLRSRSARFRHGRLFPEHSAYKALVLNEQRTMPVDVARRLVELAREGLPIVIIGALPSTTPGYSHAAKAGAQLRAAIQRLIAERGVVRVDDESAVPAALRRAHVAAAAAHRDPSSAVLSVRRHAPGIDYYYLYNQTAAAVDETVELTGSGTPYRLGAWTGKISPLRRYSARHGRISVPLRLERDQVEVIAITSRRDGTFHGPAERRPAGRCHRSGPPAGGAELAPLTLADWSLSVDSWTPGPSGLPGDTAHTTLGPVAPHAGDRGALPPWSEITPANGYDADLQDVSGVGVYTTHVRLGSDWAGVRGAHLDLGAVVDTARVTINGQRLPPLDYTDLQHIEVARYLHPGDNTIKVRVASTLLNAVRVAPGTGASGRERMDYGLLGPVRLTAYDARRPTLVAEPLEDELPLAAGGFNRAHVRISNGARCPVRVAVEPDAPDRVTATPARRSTTIPGGGSATVAVELRDRGLDSGASMLTVHARADNGMAADAELRLSHSDDLALNAIGAPLPRTFASEEQDRYPPQLATDGTSEFWVSAGLVSGGGPTPDQPATLAVDLGAPVQVGSVTMHGRASYGPRDYEVQTSDDGRSWTTRATVTDAPKTELTSTFGAVEARYVRLRITASWDTLSPPRNVQMSELEIRAP